VQDGCISDDAFAKEMISKSISLFPFSNDVAIGFLGAIASTLANHLQISA
jgi:hypothetical protein